MVFVFWGSLILLAYTFVGYPLLLGIVSLWRNRMPVRAAIRPIVSVIIAAHDEAKLIGSKIANSLDLIYPADKLEIIVASDGSHDSTCDIVRSFASRNVKLIEIPERRGKHYAQMIACDAARGEILVFTDASVRLEPDALEKIVSNFADASIGCVSSEDRVVNEAGVPMGENIYVRLEMGLRRMESRVGSLVSMSGSFFAARREVCSEWHPAQSSDFFVALHAVARGLRAVVDPECRGYYEVARVERAELRRKIRTIVHGLDVFFSHVKLLNPIRYGFFSWQLVSHKLFRWLAAFAILCVFISNLFLWKAGVFYTVTIILQAALYGSGLLALSSGPLARVKVLKLAGFFLIGNLAAILAWLKFFAGQKLAVWEPTQRR